MNSRERVIKALEYSVPDRIPSGCYNLAVQPGLRADALKRLFRKFPQDFSETKGAARNLEWGSFWQKGDYQDEWGVVWRNLRNGVIGQPIQHPLVDYGKLEEYQFPEPENGFPCIQDRFADDIQEKYFLAGGGCSLWHRLHALRGFERTLIDITQDKRDLVILIDKLVNYNLARLKVLLELEPDGVLFADDWGTQNRLMIRPEKWRIYFKLGYKKMFDLVHKKGVDVFFHSDGYIKDILLDFIEIGADALNIQVNLIGIKEVRNSIGGEICVAADVDRQHTLPFGTTREVERLVKEIILGFRNLGGGLILFGEIGPDVSIRNAESMLVSILKYGHLI